MIGIKYYVYIGIIVALLGSAWYVANTLHFKPIRLLERQLNILIIDNQAKDVTINNLSVDIVQLIENNKIVGFEEYFNGLSENNTTTTDKLIF